MSWFKEFDWSLRSILKGVGVALLGVAALSVAIMLFGFALDTLFNRNPSSNFSSPLDHGRGAYYQETDFSKDAYAPPFPPMPSSPVGADLEAFEVKEYHARLETRRLTSLCQSVADLRERKEIIFEHSDQNQDACSFRFKVEKEYEEEVASLIKKMDPIYFNANVQTIKGGVSDYENELIILNKNLEEAESALQTALESYDEVAQLAARQGDTETLASIVTHKLNLIQKLSDKRLHLQSTIERYEKNKADQLDRLNYTFFSLDIYKDVLFDWQQIKNTWRWELKELVRHFNDVLQGLTVVLLEILLRVFQGAVYFFLALIVLKGLWLGTQRIWKGKEFKRKR